MRSFAAVLLASVLLSACGTEEKEEPPMVCTLIGCGASVGVDLGRPARALWPRATDWRVCAGPGEQCTTISARERRLVSDPDLGGGESVTVSVDVLRRGRVLFSAEGRLAVLRTEPNGPGCGTCASVRARLEGTRLVAAG